MPKKLSKEEKDYNDVVAATTRIQRAIAKKFNVQLHNVVLTADIRNDGTIEINCTIHRKNKNENNQSDIT